jgi:hypothetical protein
VIEAAALERISALIIHPSDVRHFRETIGEAAVAVNDPQGTPESIEDTALTELTPNKQGTARCPPAILIRNFLCSL